MQNLPFQMQVHNCAVFSSCCAPCLIRKGSGVSVHRAVLPLPLLCSGVDGYWWQKWILLQMFGCGTLFSLCVFPSTAKFGLNVISCNWFHAVGSPCSVFCTHMRLQHWMPKKNHSKVCHFGRCNISKESERAACCLSAPHPVSLSVRGQ